MNRGHGPELGQAKKTAPAPRVLDFGAIKIDLDAYEVEACGEPVGLYLREFQILALLCQEPRRVWTREEIVRAVWGEESAVDVRTVDVHIRRLRQHMGGLRRAGAAVVTVRGVGYKFDPRKLRDL